MPTSLGPNIINDSSVVFSYDTGDTSNSWKGEPTTNLAAGGNLIGMSGITLTYVGMEGDWKKYSMSGTFTGGSYPYIMYLQPVNFAGGVQYSTQAIVKTNVLGKFNYFGTNGVSYVNAPKDNEGTLVQTTLADGSSYVARVGFAYTSTTAQDGYLWTNPINGTSFNPSTDFVYLRNFQVEQKAYTTPFTPSSRSNTQGLLDISGRDNTVTLANMTYGANNVISFDGTDDYISINNSSVLQVGDIFTINAWINPTNLNSRYGIFSTRRFNTSGCWQFEVGTASGGTNRVAVTGTGTWIFETANNVISLNVWTNICFIKPGNGVQGGTLYINGTPISPVTTTAYSIANNSDIKVIGSGTNLGQFFPGRIANVTLYNRILTATEVQNNYLAFKTRFNL